MASKFEEALDIVCYRGTSWHGGGPVPVLMKHEYSNWRQKGFLYVRCSESTDKQKLAESFSKKWKEKMNFWQTEVPECCQNCEDDPEDC